MIQKIKDSVVILFTNVKNETYNTNNLEKDLRILKFKKEGFSYVPWDNKNKL